VDLHLLKAEDAFPRPRLDPCLVRIEQRRVATRDLEPRVRDEKIFWSVVLHLHTDDCSLDGFSVPRESLDSDEGELKHFFESSLGRQWRGSAKLVEYGIYTCESSCYKNPRCFHDKYTVSKDHYIGSSA
jgi:hypothetical protein